MDINQCALIAKAAAYGRAELFRPGAAPLFFVGIRLFASRYIKGIPGGVMLLAAAVIGRYEG